MDADELLATPSRIVDSISDIVEGLYVLKGVSVYVRGVEVDDVDEHFAVSSRQ